MATVYRRPLVLLHGFAGHAASWNEVRRALPRGSAPYAYTLLGHAGEALEPDVEEGAFSREVARIAELVRADLGTFERPCLAGYSLGGRLALGLLVEHPELFGSAVVLGASPGLRDPVERTERALADERWVRLLLEEGVERFLDAWAALPLFATQNALPAAVLREQTLVRSAHDARGLAHAMRALGLGRMPDLWPALGRIEVPVTLVAGEADPKFRALAGAIASEIQGARVEIVPGAGHNVVLERPREVAALLAHATAPVGTEPLE